MRLSALVVVDVVVGAFAPVDDFHASFEFLVGVVGVVFGAGVFTGDVDFDGEDGDCDW